MNGDIEEHELLGDTDRLRLPANRRAGHYPGVSTVAPALMPRCHPPSNVASTATPR